MSNVYFDISIDGLYAGRILFRLFLDTVPRTCKNFIELSTGERGFGYAGSKFFFSIPGFKVQGGDFEFNNGTGGYSIYGKTFVDENFKHVHDKSMLLSMANTGADRNGSQFFITMAPLPDLDGKNVVFGEVVDASTGLMRRIEAFGTENGNMRATIKIDQCGLVSP